MFLKVADRCFEMERKTTEVSNGVFVEWKENPLESIITLNAIGEKFLLQQITEEAEEMKKYDDKLHIEREFKYCVEALKSYHDGDCVCQAMSCIKCLSEDYLEISTIAGTDSHARHAVENAFKHCATLTEAIYWLRNTEIIASWEGYEKHVPRWRAERERAATWLEEYAKRL